MNEDNEFVKRFVISLAKANVVALKDIIDKNESIMDKYSKNMPSTFWIKMVMNVLGIKLEEIDVEKVLAELEKQNPQIYQTIYYHANGIIWLKNQITMFKEYIEGRKKLNSSEKV